MKRICSSCLAEVYKMDPSSVGQLRVLSDCDECNDLGLCYSFHKATLERRKTYVQRHKEFLFATIVSGVLLILVALSLVVKNIVLQ